MPNCLDYVECLFAVQLLGAMAVPVNARYKARELAYVVENADLSAILISDIISEYADFAELLQEAFPELATGADPRGLELPGAPKLKTVVMLGSSAPAGIVPRSELDALAAECHDADVEDRRVCARVRDQAIMMYTSGTTSDPKGCPLSHEVLVRNGFNMNRERYFLDETDCFWAPLPMFHMASILPMICCMDAGAALQSMTHVEAGMALEMMERDATTVAFPSFPTVTNELITHPEFTTRDLSRIRRINNVAPPDVLRKFQDAFPQAVQTGAYGLTEVGGVIAFNHPDESLEQRLTTCGRAFPGVEVKVVDPDTDAELGPGERGEILVRGYAVFDGYYKAPEKNAEAFTDGWFRTGDLCALDADGSIEFHGRIKDMLKVGGENVAALEIESYLATHPAVKLAQVIGVPDERLLEVPAAFIELNPNTFATEEELIDYCKGKIASFKVPRHVRFVDEWPMSSTKVQKFRLSEQFEA
ncbi:MAG: AMP-binding protein [Pseudomonadales bacterium]|nr:acyl--CoA ligase [Pseudomonadales bacterium]NIX09186.1 AMP-binding protein [Pseudomonadales bacterium]